MIKNFGFLYPGFAYYIITDLLSTCYTSQNHKNCFFETKNPKLRYNESKDKNMEIRELVSKTKQGDQDAFAQLYDQFADRIFKFIKLKVGHQQQAEDILQDTFVKAWKGAGGLKLEGLNFSAWLYRVAHNAVNDYFRKLYRRPETLELNENLDFPSGASLTEELDSHQDAQNIKQSLRALPKQYAQVLELRFIQDFTVAETAGILGKSNLSTRLLQHRALKKLKQAISENYAHGYQKI